MIGRSVRLWAHDQGVFLSDLWWIRTAHHLHLHHRCVRVTQHIKRSLPAFPSAVVFRNFWRFAEVINHHLGFISLGVWWGCGRSFVLRRNVEQLWNSQPCSWSRTFRYHDACCFLIAVQYLCRALLCKGYSNMSYSGVSQCLLNTLDTVRTRSKHVSSSITQTQRTNIQVGSRDV